jgi:hypothetical protein
MLEFPFHASAPHLIAFAIILGLSITKPVHKIKIPNIIAKTMLPVNVLICFQIIMFMHSSLASSHALTDYLRSEQKDIDILNSVDPTPLFALYFDIEKHVWKLEKGFKTGQINQDDIYDFITWGEDVKDYFVMNRVYVRLAQSYIIAQDKDSANRVMDQAVILFPEDAALLERVAQMRAFIN